MKKIIKISSVVAIFLAIIMLHSFVSAATETKSTTSKTTAKDIVLPIDSEGKVKLTRKNSGNTVTIDLLEGEYYEKVSDLSSALQKQVNSDDKTHKAGGIYYYIPVPEGYGTVYKYAKVYNNGDKSYLFTGTFVDADFKQIPVQSGDASADYKGLKYVEGIVPVTASVYNQSKPDIYDGSSRLTGGKNEIGIIYYNEKDEAVITEEYTINIIPKMSLAEMIVKIDNITYYNGETNSTFTKAMNKDDNTTISIWRVNSRLGIEEDITSKAKITPQDTKLLTVEKNKITAKKFGNTKLKIEVNGFSAEIPFNVYVKTGFNKAMTDEDVNDIIEYINTLDKNVESIYIDFDCYYGLKDAIVPSKIIKALKENNKNLSVYIESEEGFYVWTIKAENIKDTSMDVNFKISEVDCFIDALKDKDGVAYLDFKHEGKLPGKAEVIFYKPNKEEVEKDYYVYYYNEKTKKCEYESKAKQQADGTIIFEIDHCSKRVISPEVLDSSLVAGTNANRVLDNEPKAGENLEIVNLFYMVALISVAGIVVCKIKK